MVQTSLVRGKERRKKPLHSTFLEELIDNRQPLRPSLITSSQVDPSHGYAGFSSAALIHMKFHGPDQVQRFSVRDDLGWVF